MSSRSRISRMHFLTAFCLKVLRGNARKRYCINIHGRKILHVVLYLQHNIRDILVNKCRVSQKILDWGFDKKNCRGPEGWGGHKCWVAYICLSFHIGRCYSGLYVTSRQLTMAQLDGWIRLLPHSGSILDSQLSWESGKFQQDGATKWYYFLTWTTPHPPTAKLFLNVSEIITLSTNNINGSNEFCRVPTRPFTQP